MQEFSLGGGLYPMNIMPTKWTPILNSTLYIMHIASNATLVSENSGGRPRAPLCMVQSMIGQWALNRGVKPYLVAWGRGRSPPSA